MAICKTPSRNKKDPQRLDAAYFLGAAISLVIVLVGAYNGLDNWWSRDALNQQRLINDRQTITNTSLDSRIAAIEREMAARTYRIDRIEKDLERINERH